MRLDVIQPILEKWSIELKLDFAFQGIILFLSTLKNIDPEFIKTFEQQYREQVKTRTHFFLSEMGKPENQFTQEEINFVTSFINGFIDDTIKSIDI